MGSPRSNFYNRKGYFKREFRKLDIAVMALLNREAAALIVQPLSAYHHLSSKLEGPPQEGRDTAAKRSLAANLIPTPLQFKKVVARFAVKRERQETDTRRVDICHGSTAAAGVGNPGRSGTTLRSRIFASAFGTGSAARRLRSNAGSKSSRKNPAESRRS